MADQIGGDALAMDVEPGSLTVTAWQGEQCRIADLACPFDRCGDVNPGVPIQ